MESAALAIRAWLERVAPQVPVADIKACEIGRSAGMRVRVLYQGLEAFPALGLEPEVGTITVGLARPRPVSVYDKFVNDTAADIVNGHGVTWGDALDMARRCWDRIDDGLKPFMAGAVLPTADGGVVTFPDEPDDGSGIDPLHVPDRS